jgi:hypothetical protein
MIVPMQFHSLESMDPSTVQIKLVSAKEITWQPGQVGRFAIPDVTLGPNSGKSIIVASSPDEFFFEFYIVIDNSPFIQTLFGLEENALVYIKLEEEVYALPEQGTWLLTKDAIGLARAYVKKYQATAEEITVVLYQTGKTYFGDITRVCGQNPQFTILVANTLAELAFRLQKAPLPLTVATGSSDATWLLKWVHEFGVDESNVQSVIIR